MLRNFTNEILDFQSCPYKETSENKICETGYKKGITPVILKNIRLDHLITIHISYSFFDDNFTVQLCEILKKNETVLIKLGISCESLENKSYYLMPRSSISKTPLRMSNSVGLIDAGYRGEIMASCDNIKNYDYQIKAGQRLFKLVAPDASPISYEIVETLSETDRGSGGFGSTGK